MSGTGLPSADEVRDLVINALTGAALGSGVSSAYDDKAKANDYFEAFIFTTLLEEAVANAWAVTIVDTAGAEQQELLLRAAPGSFENPTQPYTHAVLSRRGAFDLEAHVGVKVRGASGVLHEADLLLLPRAVAESCREDDQAPEVRQCTGLFEAKFIEARSVPLGYGRGLLGLDCDMLQLPRVALVTTRPSDSVDALLRSWSIAHVGEVLPRAGVIDDDELREFLSEVLAWWARSGRWWNPSVTLTRPRPRRRR